MKRIPIDVVDRYMVGACAREECADVERWLAEPNHRVLLEALRQTALGDVSFSDVRGQDATWERVWRRASSGGRPVARAGRMRRSETRQGPLWRYTWFAAAALVLGLVVLVMGWPTEARHSGRSATEPTLAYTTGRGERATITLPDGGTVALNVASRLEVPGDYMTGQHTVRLVGEGFFTVPHQDGAPFTVLAGGTAARVLGTSFLVRRYATDTTTLVAVRDGKVAVGSTVVTAAHLVEVGRTGVARVRPSDGSPFTFATGVLTLNGVPLSAAVVELDRWYDADVRLGSPSLATHRLRGEFSAGSLSDLAEDLEFVLGVRVVRDGRVLTLFPKE